MKLSGVKTYVVRTRPPNLGGALWFFVKLETDDGFVGWGETAVLGTLFGVESGWEHAVRGSFDRYLKGKNPLDRELLYQTLYAGMTAQHPDYTVMGIISAFDIALWDICGKFLGSPVYNLLGGKFRDKVRTYTYVYNREATKDLREATSDWTKDPTGLARSAELIAAEGFTGLKFDPLRQSRRPDEANRPWEISLEEYDHAEEAVRQVRAAVGSGVDICIGTHGQITPASARRLALRLEVFSPLWFEEPCPPENYAEMAKVARSTSIPIATGERLVTLFEFQNLFREGACAIAQPDLGSCGGITACRKIAHLAEANYVLMAPHVWGGPIITAAALQIDATIPNFLIQESIYKSRDLFDDLLVEPFDWQEGYLVVPDRPGIGFELKEESLRAMSFSDVRED